MLIWLLACAIANVCVDIDLDREIYRMFPTHEYPSAIPIAVLTLFTIFALVGTLAGMLLARKYRRLRIILDDEPDPLD